VEWRDRKGVDGNAHDSLIAHSKMGCACMSWLTGLLLMSLACQQQQQRMFDAVAPPFSQPSDETGAPIPAGIKFTSFGDGKITVRNYRCFGCFRRLRSQCLVSVGGST